MSDPALFGIVGPTASGKTELALAVAKRLPVEILVADSRQVYLGMDVGTAKPNAAAQAAVPHHLIDLVRPDEPFYVAALVDGHDYASQPWSPAVRARLGGELETEGLGPLVDRLRALDPSVAAGIDLRNPRRVLRALERAEVGGGGVVPRATPHAGAVMLLG